MTGCSNQIPNGNSREASNNDALQNVSQVSDTNAVDFLSEIFQVDVNSETINLREDIATLTQDANNGSFSPLHYKSSESIASDNPELEFDKNLGTFYGFTEMNVNVLSFSI